MTIDIHRPEFADLYDELPLWSAPFGLLLLDRVPLRSGLQILDVGAGTGFLAVELAQRCGADATVWAVDPWAAAMQRLRRKVQFLELPNLRLLERDASDTGLAGASIDLVVSNLGINNFANAAAVLRECQRVLRPQGRLLLTSNLSGHMAELYDALRTVLEEQGLHARLPHLDRHIAQRGTATSISALLTDAGFTVQHVSSSAFRMRFANGTTLLRHHFVRLAFLDGWQSIVAASDWPAVRDALEHKLNQIAASAGELALSVPMICIEAVESTAR